MKQKQYDIPHDRKQDQSDPFSGKSGICSDQPVDTADEELGSHSHEHRNNDQDDLSISKEATAKSALN
jgi:hypothetical protein